MKKLPKLNLKLPLVYSEKMPEKKEIAIRTEEEINQYKRAIGYRKARIKRYGNIPAKKAR